MEHRTISNLRFPWRVALALALVLLLSISVGWWRATGVGPPVQVPMFYDAHYLFPRPWTQAQAAPGVPDPAPVAAFHGPNRVSQSFVAGAGRLAMITVWLAGPAGTAVDVTLTGEAGPLYGGAVALTKGEAGGYYHLTFPSIADARGRTFRLTLAATPATGDQPVVTRTVGGDRLGGSVRLNEYGRPGNLELYTYSAGLPGRWWFDSLAEQLLPALFRLRLRQYKPAGFKGAAFPLLLGLSVVLSAAFLVLARPSSWPLPEVACRWSIGLLAGLLVWQAASGRLRLPLLTPTVPLSAVAEPLAVAPATNDSPRLVNDMVLALWTAEREPEARLVTTDMVADYPAIRVPGQSALRYALTMPLNGRLRAGVVVEGSGELRFTVRLDEQEIAAERLAAGENAVWFDLDLSPWQGQAGSLRLVTEPVSGKPDGVWLMPQLHATPEWLLSDPLPPGITVHTAGFRFNEDVELAGYQVEPASPRPGDQVEVILYWRPQAPLTAYATIFVHLLDENGAIVAQHDGQPVAGTYPLPNWQPGAIVADRHPLRLPADLPAGQYALAVGLYDPDTLARWSVAEPDGATGDDGRALLATSLTVEAAP